MKLISSIVIAIAALATSASAQISATLTEVTPGERIRYSVGRNSSTTTAGVLNWNNNTTGGSFTTFCIELDQGVAFHRAYDFDVNSQLTEAPVEKNNGNRFTRRLGRVGMSGHQAELVATVASVVSTQLNSGGLSDATAAAAQIMIWEIVHDFTDVASLEKGFRDGKVKFHIRGGSEKNKAIRAAYKNIFKGLEEGPLNAITNVFALTSSKVQDQVVITGSVVPLPPAAFAGLATGVLLIPVARRRFMK